ncbi:MAG TPA: GAF domain-containing protein [Chloroflexi bacterium]|nr:GAF domain-containing protein [Chloroflexota bacterium]
MLHFWILDPDPASISWARAALETHFNGARVLSITSTRAWKRALKHEAWPQVILTEAQLPWGTVEDLLAYLTRQHRHTPVILLSDRVAEGTVAHLFDRGLDDYLPKTPPQPLLLAARARRLLADYAPLRHQLTYLKRLDKRVFASDNPHVIATEALTLLAESARAIWGASVVVRNDSSQTGEVLAVYQPIGTHLTHAGEHCPLEVLPPIPPMLEWHFSSIEKLPVAPLRHALRKKGVQWVGVYRLPIGPNIYGLLHLGWQQQEDATPSILEFISTTVHWLSSAVYRAIKLREERHALYQARALTNLVLSLNRSLDTDMIFRRLLEGLQAVVPYEQASVWEWTEDDDLIVRHISGYAVTPEEFNAQINNLPLPPREWPTMTILVETRRPLLIPDVTQFPDWQPLDFTQNVRCWLGVPLIYNDKTIGVLALDASEPYRFTEEHMHLAQTLASAATIALQNARLFQHEHRRREELNTLRLASLQLVASLEPSEVLSNLLWETLRIVDADDAHIFLYDGEKITFGTAIWDGKIQDHPLNIPRPHGITYTVAHSGQMRVVPNIRKDPLFTDAPWEGAIISIPLIAHGKVHGVMNVAWHRPRRFSRDETSLLQMLADYAAIALENARLVDTLQSKIRQLSVLSAASAALREANTPQEIAQKLAEQAIRLGKAESAMIVRYADEAKTQAVVEYVIGMDAHLIGHFFSPTSGGLTHYLAQANRLVTFRDLSQSPLLQHPHWVRHIGPAVAIPLHTRSGDMVGMLLVGRPHGAEPFSEEEITPLDALAEIGATALQRAHTSSQLEEAFLQAVLALSQAMDARDHYHGGHSKQLAEWSGAVAHAMGLSEEETETVRLAALLHDIGKIGIPDEILLKPGPLTPREWEIMRQHPLIGARILRPLRRLEAVAQIVEAHHERWDGSGYPRGLKGEAIPLGARILAVVDSYGAMIDKRVYHAPRSHEEAVAEIRRQAGKLYDPHVVEAFLEVIDYLSPSPPPRASHSPRPFPPTPAP